MKILVACDKFRGSLTAGQANAAILAGLSETALRARARCETVPIADGGEGTLEALTSTESRVVTSPARDPFGTVCDVEWLYDPARQRAVIEMARVAGHVAAARSGYDPDRATSAGVGDLIRAALEEGAREVVVALGGSITVDAGAGALESLGARFADAEGNPLADAAGRTLAHVAKVDLSDLDPRARGLSIIVAADVDNPLVGPNGAAAVFGPQKGVARHDIPAFDVALGSFERVLAAAAGRMPLTDAAFAGAAGGMLCGLSAIARTTARDGFALVSEHHDLAGRVREADLVVTGEGSLDSQSLGGKGPVAIARMAQDVGVPAIAFAGRLAASPAALREHGIVAAFSISPGPQSLEEALAGAADALAHTAVSAFSLYAAAVGARTDR